MTHLATLLIQCQITHLMLHNNNYSYQRLPSNCTFDLKVNVDFGSGKVNLGLPTPPPFAKKQEVPLMHPQPVYLPHYSPYHSAYTPIYPANHSNHPNLMPSSQPPHVWQAIPNYNKIQGAYNSAYPQQLVEQSYLMQYSDKQKGRSANDTYPESSFSMGIEKSMDAVECVICNKPVNREQFHSHLEQHKNRRLEQNRREAKSGSQVEKQASFSVRNHNSLENVAELYREIPSRATQGQFAENNNANLQHSDSALRSPQIQHTHSRIVYAPRDPSQIVSASGSSESAYSRSLGPEQSHLREIQRKPVIQGTSGLHNHQDSYSQQQYANRINSHSSRDARDGRAIKGSSSNLVTSQLSRRQDSKSLSQNKQPIKSYYQQNSRSSSSFHRHSQNRSPPEHSCGMERTESRIVSGQQKKQPSFEDIQQSVIHRINDLSRDYSILQLKKQLKISQIEEQSSSDEQQGRYVSARGYPPSNLYQSISKSKQSAGMSSSSNLTAKLARTKLPVNYLAREEFIVSSMLTRSCYKSKHSSWK